MVAQSLILVFVLVFLRDVPSGDQERLRRHVNLRDEGGHVEAALESIQVPVLLAGGYVMGVVGQAPLEIAEPTEFVPGLAAEAAGVGTYPGLCMSSCPSHGGMSPGGERWHSVSWAGCWLVRSLRQAASGSWV